MNVDVTLYSAIQYADESMIHELMNSDFPDVMYSIMTIGYPPNNFMGGNLMVFPEDVEVNDPIVKRYLRDVFPTDRDVPWGYYETLYESIYEYEYNRATEIMKHEYPELHDEYIRNAQNQDYDATEYEHLLDEIIVMESGDVLTKIEGALYDYWLENGYEMLNFKYEHILDLVPEVLFNPRNIVNATTKSIF